jgi:DivIVA domain-containing protein
MSPIEIQQKTFGTALRGYDLDEVDDFLDQVVTTLNSYEQRLSDAQERIAALEAEAANRGDSESVISRALVAAQRSADQIVEDAQAEAVRITEAANAEGGRMIEEARRLADDAAAERSAERARLETETTALRVGVSELREKVRSLMKTIDAGVDEIEAAVDDTEQSLLGRPPAPPAEEEPDILPFEPPGDDRPAEEDQAPIEAWLTEPQPESDDGDEDSGAEELFEEIQEVGGHYDDDDDFDDVGAAQQQIERVRRPWESD